MKACCGKGRSGPIPWRINFCECHLVTVAALGTDELMLQNKRREFLETARRFPLGGIVQIGMMEHTTLADLAAICLARFVSRGGEILVPTSVKLATCHYRRFASRLVLGYACRHSGGDRRLRRVTSRHIPQPLQQRMLAMWMGRMGFF